MTCFLQFSDQTKQTASRLLAHLLHITTKMEEGSQCKPHAAPLWAARFPFFLSSPVRQQALSMRTKARLPLLKNMLSR